MGGAIYNTGTLNVEYASSFMGNSGIYGGAIYNAAGGTASVTGPTFSGNSAGSYGGALFNMGTMTVSGTLSDNTAGFGGGAVYNQGLMTILSSTLNGNSDPYTGATNGGTSTTPRRAR